MDHSDDDKERFPDILEPGEPTRTALFVGRYKGPRIKWKYNAATVGDVRRFVAEIGKRLVPTTPDRACSEASSPVLEPPERRP